MVEFSESGDGLWKRGFAGDTLNVAWAARALLPESKPVAYLTRAGVDDISSAMTSFIAEAGIVTDPIQTDPERTVGLYSITVDEAGERSFSYWRSASAARHLADDTEQLAHTFEKAELVYLSGITAAILGERGRANLLSAVNRAKRSGTRFAYDPNYRPKLWGSLQEMQDFTAQIVARTDIVLPTFDDEQLGFGDRTPSMTKDRLVRWGCPEVVVKNGTQPTLVRTETVEEAVAVRSPQRPVDTTGAGDSFNGGYLAARLEGHSAQYAATLAQAVAARVVMQRGALVDMDALREIRDKVE